MRNIGEKERRNEVRRGRELPPSPFPLPSPLSRAAITVGWSERERGTHPILRDWGKTGERTETRIGTKFESNAFEFILDSAKTKRLPDNEKGEREERIY